MTSLVAFLFFYYLVAYRRPLWKKFTSATNGERVLFGAIVFESALWYLSGR